MPATHTRGGVTSRVNAPVYRRGDARMDVNVAVVYCAPVRCQRPFIGRHCLYALLIILIPRNFPYAYAPFVMHR